MTRTLILGIAAAALASAAPACAQSVVITNARLVVGDGSPPIDGATIVVRDGRVVSAGRGGAVPAGAQHVDAGGKWVSPGIVAGFTRMGIVGVDAVDPTNDSAARNSPFSASIDVTPAVNPDVPEIAISRAAGVTRAIIAPAAAANMFAGQGAVIDTSGRMRSVTAPRAFQFVEFGEEGATRAGGSRPAAHAFFRNALAEARDYARNPAGYDGRSKDSMLLRRDAAALVPVVTGAEPLYVHVEGASDILAVLDLRREFPALRLVLVGVSEGWRVAREIAAANVPVIASPLNDLPASFETVAATQSNIGRMVAAGVRVAIGTIDDDDPRMAQRSRQYAGNLVALTRVPGASGLSWDQAFAAISGRPAEVAGLGGQIGTLRPGRQGDVVIWSGDPLELSSLPERVWIDGVEQSIETRQTRLRDRYRTPSDPNLPKAYNR